MKLLPLIGLTTTVVCSSIANAYEAPHAPIAPTIDGQAKEAVWNKAEWVPMDKHMIGEAPGKDDFQGRFKVVWDASKLYILTEIVDDVLFDQHSDPLYFYWDDDCLEIFVDEDKSGGTHQFDYNAFAYHVALDNQAVDIGPNNADGSTGFVLLNDHIDSRWQRSSESPHKIIWEVAMSIYGDDFKTQYKKNEKPAVPVSLEAGKRMGFMMAYCDNDGSKHREHFYGSTEIEPVNGDKNRGYIDASVFGDLVLVK